MNNFGYGGTNAHIIMENYNSFKSSTYYAQNDVSNGVSNGITHKVTNGTTSRITNGVTNGERTNGLTNGAINGLDGHRKNLRSKIIILSARDEQAAEAMASNLREHLMKSDVGHDEDFLNSLAYTLDQRRTKFPWIAAQSIKHVSGLVTAIKSGRMKPTRTKDRPRLGFVFTGQGAQWYAMGRELIEVYPVFKASLEEAEHYLRELGATWSLLGTS